MQCCYHGIASYTRRTYQSGLNAYFSFCARFKISPAPASPLTLQYFCVDASQHVSYKTLKIYLAGIRLMHIEQGLPDPTDDNLLHLVCRGIRRQQGDHQRPRLPITINLLQVLKEQLRASYYSLHEQRMLWAAFTLAFYGFLCVSEYTALCWSNITLTVQKIAITLCQSKTDPFRCGQSIRIYPTNSSTCPLRAFQLYTRLTQEKPVSALVFTAGRFSPLTRIKLNATLRYLLCQAGVDQHNYSSHSFRIGAATTAAAAGLPVWLIKTLGRWSSNAYQSYIRCPIAITSSVPKLLAKTDAANQPTWNVDR